MGFAESAIHQQVGGFLPRSGQCLARRSRLATTARSASAVVLERSFPKAGLPRPCVTHFSFLRFATIQQCDRKFATQVPISRGYEATVPQISSLSTRTHASYCVLFSRH